MIRNPLTHRLIKIDGPTYKKLLLAGYIHENGILILPVASRPKRLNPDIPSDILGYIHSKGQIQAFKFFL